MKTNEGQTHWVGCWAEPRHHACAITEIERLTAEVREGEDLADTQSYQIDYYSDEIELLDAENSDLNLLIAKLKARVDAFESLLYSNGFVPCDIPYCNCGSWHQTGGFAARFREIDEATNDFWRNGETLLDRIKRIAATEQETEA